MCRRTLIPIGANGDRRLGRSEGKGPPLWRRPLPQSRKHQAHLIQVEGKRAYGHRREKRTTQSAGAQSALFLNFFMADMQAGIGPFLGVFLLAHQWNSGLIGTVMTLGGNRRHAHDRPGGRPHRSHRFKARLRDRFRHRHVLASAIILLSQTFWVVTFRKIATAIAGAAIGPAVTGLTLGIVKQKGFNQQNGRPGL